MIQHATDADSKQARRDTILAAARLAFLAAPDKLPSSAVIADAAGLAKGTVYLYFRTKEEIFLALLEQARGQLLEQFYRAFADDGRAAAAKIADVITAHVDFVSSHPEMLRLDALGYGVLERNLAPEVLQAHKQALTVALAEAGAMVEASLGLAAGPGMRLLIHTHALTLGLWQSLDVPASCRALLAETAAPLMQMDFRTELQAALTQYWHGLTLIQ